MKESQETNELKIRTHKAASKKRKRQCKKNGGLDGLDRFASAAPRKRGP